MELLELPLLHMTEKSTFKENKVGVKVEIIKKMIKIQNIRKTYMYLKKNGLKSTYYASIERIREKDHKDYKHRELSLKERQAQKDINFGTCPKFSILVPAFETREAHLREMVDSVLRQTYSDLELVIADASATDTVEQIVLEYQKRDSRIIYKRIVKNKGISANSNEALNYVTGDYVGLLDHDDVLTEDALFEMAKAIEGGSKKGISIKILYSDEDKGDEELTAFYEPHYKPEFNLDLLLSNNYICHFLVMKTEWLKELGFREEYDGAQDYDLVLRAAGRLTDTNCQEIVHISGVLYHWRCHRGSTAENPASKMYAYEAGKRALEDFCSKKGYDVSVSHSKHLGFYKVHFEQEDKKDSSVRYNQQFFEIRQDVGAVGGRIVCHSKITGGAYLEDGTILYEGLNKHFSGYMHRAALKQNVPAVDIRCMLVKSEFGTEYTVAMNRIKSLGKISKELLDKQYVEESLKLCQYIRKKGYRILWDPEMEKRCDE